MYHMFKQWFNTKTSLDVSPRQELHIADNCDADQRLRGFGLRITSATTIQSIDTVRSKLPKSIECTMLFHHDGCFSNNLNYSFAGILKCNDLYIELGRMYGETKRANYYYYFLIMQDANADKQTLLTVGEDFISSLNSAEHAVEHLNQYDFTILARAVTKLKRNPWPELEFMILNIQLK